MIFSKRKKLTQAFYQWCDNHQCDKESAFNVISFLDSENYFRDEISARTIMSEKENISEKISEQTAREILKIAYYTLGMADAINTLRDKGYIKQSKLEVAREWIKKWGNSDGPLTQCYQDDCAYIIRLHEAAIAEILEEKT